MISPVLRQAELNVMSNDDCADAWEKLGEGGGQMIQPQMLCAGGGEAGPCNVRKTGFLHECQASGVTYMLTLDDDLLTG